MDARLAVLNRDRCHGEEGGDKEYEDAGFDALE